jgi:alcohol dehydrogenase/L-iditol 2-dehydrogenase
MPAVVNYGAAPDSVELREVPVPKIGENDVLLRVEAVSVCGSDLHQWLGGISWKVNYPCVLGHEFAGIVEEGGSRVKAFQEGDRVVSETAAVIDANSPLTKRGLYNLDPSRLGFGYGVDGAMTEYVEVPERCLHALPAELGFLPASLTEPCSVAYNAVCVNTTIRPGDTVVVLGPGPIGLLCAMMAKLSGAGTLIVAGLANDAKRLEVARTIGADQTVTEDLRAQVMAAGDGLGADVVIDAAGVSATLELATQLVRPAGQITKVGWGPQPMGFSLDPVVQKNVTVQGSFSHNWPIWERVVGMMASGQLDITPLINRTGPLEDWRACFEGMHSGEYVKAVLTPAGLSDEKAV